MAEEDRKSIGITIKKEEDMAEWYSQVIIKSGFADYAPVKGCMIIRPLAYSCWQSLMDFFNANIKKLKVENAYFPMFIPESFFKKEAEHAAGFSPEVAWIENKDEKQERLAIRPTSETIMYDSYSRWIRSYRDLPLRINQWCNICRWEVQDTKLFLRSREFLWQEGHCVYETEKECDKEARKYLEEYRKVAEDLLAIPIMLGEKTVRERFAGAKRTYTIEGFMPDGKALQLGTSHNLGQGFAKAFNIQYVDRDEQKKLPWQNSWGISTRMLGGMVMTHSDNKGLVLPPRVAPNKVVVVPIIFGDTKEAVFTKAKEIHKSLKSFNPILDDREEVSSGWKFNEWELKGIPLRLEIGPRDMQNNQVIIVRRDTNEKKAVPMADIKKEIPKLLSEMQKSMLENARKKITENTVDANDFVSFEKAIAERKLVKVNSCCEVECEDKIKEKLAATARCIPFNTKIEKGAKCFHCGKDAKNIVFYGKNY